MTDEPISLGSASHIALSPWRSTKDDPPKPEQRVIPRHWGGDRWLIHVTCDGAHVIKFANDYPSWTPYPVADDGTTPKDWS
jgi:hypothetical protein